MIVPDYVEPLTAYRVWQWDAIGLKSLNNSVWLPGQPLEASCNLVMHRGDVKFSVSSDGLQTLIPVSIPGDTCTCGIYAAKNLKHLTDIGYADHGIQGEVNLWGRVVIHKMGFRAQFAYPKSLVIPANFIPVSVAMMESRIETLTAYGVPIRITDVSDVPDVLLWSKEAGFNPRMVDWLLRRADRPSSYNRKLKVGDRVAVHKGIGIVQNFDSNPLAVDGREVEIAIFGRLLVSVPRLDITWNQENWRWEALDSDCSVHRVPSFQYRQDGKPCVARVY